MKNQQKSPLIRILKMPAFLRFAIFINNKVIGRTGIKFAVESHHLPMTSNHLKKLLFFKDLFGLIKDVAGEIVECGVDQGESLALLALLTSGEDLPRNVWGFDSFQGFPEPHKYDINSKNPKAQKGIYDKGSIGVVTNNLKIAGLSDDFITEKVHLVKGWLEDTLPDYQGNDIALLNIDVDLYESTMVTLTNLWPRVVSGGIVVFDEYHTPDIWPGEKRAVDEFFNDLKSAYTWHQDPFSGRYYVIKK